MTPKAYSYIRFSTLEQAKGDSKRRQWDGCEAFCAAEGLELATEEEYTFFDRGRSAYKGEHLGDEGELRRFLTLVENGSIKPGSWLIVESLDRLSRENINKALPRFLDLLDKGINIYTVADRHSYTKNYELTDLIISIISMSRAYEESRNKGMRVSEAWQRKQQLAREEKKPLGAAAPSWLTYTRDNGYQINEERAGIVKRIFDMCINGRGKASICKQLNQDGILAFGGANRGAKTQTWSNSSIQKLLTNRAVLGEYQPHNLTEQGSGKPKKRLPSGEPVKDYFPRIIDTEIFYQAQAATNSRLKSRSTKQTKNFNIWSGIVKCGQCGSAMHIVDKGKPPKGAKYLICWNKRKGICSSGNLRLDKSEVAFREVLAKVDSLALVQDSSTQISKRINETEGQIVELQGKLQKAGDAFNVSPSTFVAQKITEFERQITELKNQKHEQEILLANSKISSKKEFFAKLDLESFEGRSRANGLLKRLGIEIFARKKHEAWIYKAHQKDEPVFAIIQTNGYTFPLAFTDTQLQKIVDQEKGWMSLLSALSSEKIVSKDYSGLKELLKQVILETLTTKRKLE